MFLRKKHSFLKLLWSLPYLVLISALTNENGVTKYLNKSEYEELTSREFNEHYLYVNLALDQFSQLTVDLNIETKTTSCRLVHR